LGTGLASGCGGFDARVTVPCVAREAIVLSTARVALLTIHTTPHRVILTTTGWTSRVYTRKSVPDRARLAITITHICTGIAIPIAAGVAVGGSGSASITVPHITLRTVYGLILVTASDTVPYVTTGTSVDNVVVNTGLAVPSVARSTSWSVVQLTTIHALTTRPHIRVCTVRCIRWGSVVYANHSVPHITWLARARSSIVNTTITIPSVSLLAIRW
jgi:hypothetical protein